VAAGCRERDEMSVGGWGGEDCDIRVIITHNNS